VPVIAFVDKCIKKSAITFKMTFINYALYRQRSVAHLV